MNLRIDCRLTRTAQRVFYDIRDNPNSRREEMPDASPCHRVTCTTLWPSS